jgi:hypothetical protein
VYVVGQVLGVVEIDEREITDLAINREGDQ